MSGSFEDKRIDSLGNLEAPRRGVDESVQRLDAFEGLENLLKTARKIECDLKEERLRAARLEESQRAEKREWNAQVLQQNSKIESLGIQLEAAKKQSLIDRDACLRHENESSTFKELAQQLQLENARLVRELEEVKQKSHLEIGNLGVEHKRASGELRSIKIERQRLESEVFRFAQERERAEAEISQLKLEVRRLSSEISALGAATSEERNRLHFQLRAMETERSDLQGSHIRVVDRLRTTINELEATLKRSQARVENQEVQNRELNRKLQLALTEFESNRLKTANEKAELKELEAKLSYSRREWAERIQGEAKKSETLRRELAEVESLNRALEENIKELRQRAEWAESEGPAFELRQKIDQLEVQIRSLTAELEKEHKQSLRYQKENAELLRYSEKIRVAAKEAESRVFQMEPELQSARRKLQAESERHETAPEDLARSNGGVSERQ